MTRVVQVKESTDGISKSDSDKSSKRILLVGTLQPLWKMTEFTGFLLDWGGNPLISPSLTSLVKILKNLRNILCVTTAFVVFLAVSVYLIIQIGIGSVFSMIPDSEGSSKSILGLIVTVVFLIPVIHTAWNIFMFTLNRIVVLIPIFPRSLLCV